MAAPRKYPDELRERAVRLYRDSGPKPVIRRLADASIAPSTGSVGDSFDNALAENLWSTLKTELIYWPATTFATRTDAEAAIFRYIDGWYNPRRIQERLGGLSPDEYEEAYYLRQQDQSDPATIQPDPAGAR